MEKIVTKGLKIDLHIHSVYSSKKDGQKVSNNTLENIPVLLDKLNENGIEMCAITDHDTFNYSIYEELRKAESQNNSIKKVLPGIEFSVDFQDNREIHIITIFNDSNAKKIKAIEDVFATGIGKSLYKNGRYTKEDFYKILRTIDLDFVMIAHQKKSPASRQSPKKKDVLSLGQETFNDLIAMEYFEAFEFREKNNEIYNKLYALEKHVEEKLRFITGSDCHNWFNYPNTNINNSDEIQFTFLKSLPTFKGLAMAITDKNRINYTDSFFGQGKYLENLIFEIEGEECVVPLSKGINVIIGDNSVGKSLLLHELTDNRQLIGKRSSMKKGYSKYLNKNNLNIKTHIPENDIFKFNYQGNIREIFDNPDLKVDKYLSEYAPDDIDVEKYRKPVERELERLYECISSKFEYDKEVNNLQTFAIPDVEPLDKELTIGGKIATVPTTELNDLIKNLTEIIGKLKSDILLNPELQKNDSILLQNEIEVLETMKIAYEGRAKERNLQRRKINIYNTSLSKYKEEYLTRQTDENNAYHEFINNLNQSKNDIINLVLHYNQIKDFEFDLEEIIVTPEQNPIDKYIFVSKIDIEKIDNNYMIDLIERVLKKGKKIKVRELTEKELKENINRFPEEIENALEGFKLKVKSKLDTDFEIKQIITENDKDVFQKLSDGFDARMYFRLLSGEEKNKGIYIVDQPEDHISPRAIKGEVIEQFRRMSRKRQIIMVTHNPQFIVNLDVDNVIFLHQESDGFKVDSGALEFECDEYAILKIVADNIDGGLDTIKKRMKRYDKDIQF